MGARWPRSPATGCGARSLRPRRRARSPRPPSPKRTRRSSLSRAPRPSAAAARPALLPPRTGGPASSWPRPHQRLEILPAGLAAFVADDGARAGFRQHRGGGGAGGARADHEHVDAPPLQWAGRRIGQRRERVGVGHGARHRHAGLRLLEAGADPCPAIDGHDAVEAAAHAAMQPARRAPPRAPQRQRAAGRQRRSDALARAGHDRCAVESEADGLVRGNLRAHSRHHVARAVAYKAYTIRQRRREGVRQEDRMTNFRGTYTVLVTPFTADGSAVDLSALAVSSNSRSPRASTA